MATRALTYAQLGLADQEQRVLDDGSESDDNVGHDSNPKLPRGAGLSGVQHTWHHRDSNEVTVLYDCNELETSAG